MYQAEAADDKEVPLSISPPEKKVFRNQLQGVIWLGRCYANALSGGTTSFGLTFVAAYMVQYVVLKRLFRNSGKWVPLALLGMSRQFRNTTLVFSSTVMATSVAYDKVHGNCDWCYETWRKN